MMSTSLFIGCTSDDSLKGELQEVNLSMISKRDYQEALSIANQATSMLNDSDRIMRGLEPSQERMVDLAQGVKYVVENRTLTKSIQSSASDTLLYIFNYKNNRGYAVVSASRNTEGLIAVTDSGHFESIANSNNPGLCEYMSLAMNYVKIAEEKPVTKLLINPGGRLHYKIFYDTVSQSRIYPKVKVKWGQEDCEGAFCPNGISGCANTAAAMAMTYFKYPASMTLTYPGASASSVTFNWNDICNYKPIVSTGYDCSDNGKTSIGYLCRQLGYLSGSSYYSTTTSTPRLATRIVMQNLGYTVSDTASYKYGCFYPLLNNNRLVLMTGFTSDGGGHMWLVDGYHGFVLHSYECTSVDGVHWTEINDGGQTPYNYYHMNWGWNGTDNGYFADGVFDSYLCNPLDNGSTHEVKYAFVQNLNYFSVSH